MSAAGSGRTDRVMVGASQPTRKCWTELLSAAGLLTAWENFLRHDFSLHMKIGPPGVVLQNHRLRDVPGASGVSMKGDGAGSEMPGPQAVSQTQVRKAAP